MTIVTNGNRVNSLMGEPVPHKIKHKQCPDAANESIHDQLLKHPLKNSWTLWYYQNQRSNSWLENQKKVSDKVLMHFVRFHSITYIFLILYGQLSNFAILASR